MGPPTLEGCMGQVWEGTSPRWAGAPPTGPKAQGSGERGQTLGQMGPKAHPRCASPSSPSGRHQSREPLAAGHVATVVLAIAARVRAHHCTQCTPARRLRPPVAPAVRCNAVFTAARTPAPPRAPFRRAPLPLCPPVASIRCARSPAARSTKPPLFWSPEGKTRAPLPSLVTPATSRGSTPTSLTPVD